MERKKILIEASGAHVHLTQEAVERLFGAGKTLIKRRDLSQPGEFLSEQRVRLVTRDGTVDNVAVLGPVRASVQVELSKTDCKKLGIFAPVNLSGHLDGATDVMIIGDRGEMMAQGAVIVARNHIHMRPKDAVYYGVRDGQTVDVEIESERKVTFKEVPVRVSEKFMPVMHIDFDEANACGYRVGTEAFILCGNEECNGGSSVMDREAIIREVVKSVCEILSPSSNEKKEEGCCAIEPCVQTEKGDVQRKAKVSKKAVPYWNPSKIPTWSQASSVSDVKKEAVPVWSQARTASYHKPKQTVGRKINDSSEAIVVRGEKVITERRARELASSCAGAPIAFGEGTILTPSAKDVFKNAKITYCVM